MTLNAREFQKRSEDVFAGTYLNSVGITQNVALGVLVAKLYENPPTLQLIAQGVASFAAIMIIANQYSWWILVVRRTPHVQDYFLPYALGVIEFGAMANVGNYDGTWFLTAGLLGLTGTFVLICNRTYATPEIFVECMWLRPLIRKNLLTSALLTSVTGIIMMDVAIWYKNQHGMANLAIR